MTGQQRPQKDMNTHTSSNTLDRGYSIDKDNWKQIRILQRNIVYVIGIPEKIANNVMIGSQDYFGQYGDIIRIVINTKPHFTEKKRDKFYSCYITYTSPESACLAIIATFMNPLSHLSSLQTSYATVKFCMFFAKSKVCRVKNCRFCHFMPPKSEIIFDVKDLTEKAGTNMALFDLQREVAFEWAQKNFTSIALYQNQLNPQGILPSVNQTISYMYMHIMDAVQASGDQGDSQGVVEKYLWTREKQIAKKKLFQTQGSTRDTNEVTQQKSKDGTGSQKQS